MDIPAGAVIASRYRVVRELGRGGMGAVYLTEHVHTGDHVALKVLLGAGAVDPDTLERFKREARAPAKIKSDHVVKVLDADTAPELGGAPFLVMELLQGTDLQKIVRKQGRVGPDLVVDWLSQAGRALDKAHAIGIVHRDLKPENLFLHQREDGTTIVKVLDFGISKILAQAHASVGPMTQLGSVMGTPLFMSPEQARGAVHQIGPATDVWAIGLVALHLLTGEHYWGSPRTLAELMTAIIRCELYPPTQRWPFLPALFDAWFVRSCAREPAQRFTSVGEQVASLATALGIHLSQNLAPRSGGPTVTDAYGATAAAPSAPPAMPPTAPMMGQPPPQMTPYPAYAVTPGMPTPQVPPGGWGASPIVGASTTGAVSHDPRMAPAPPIETPSSAGRVLAFGAAVFVACVGIGLFAYAFLHKPDEKASAGPAITAPTAPPSVDLTQPEDSLPSLTRPPPTFAGGAPHPSARPSASAPPNNAPPPASAPPNNAGNANNPSNAGKGPSAYQACLQRCTAECRADSDPVGCAQDCTVDRCSKL